MEMKRKKNRKSSAISGHVTLFGVHLILSFGHILLPKEELHI